MKKRLWILLLAMAAAKGQLAYAADPEVQSMRGLDSLKIVVEGLTENLKNLGLSQSAMETIARAHLQQQFHIKLDDNAPVFVYIKCRAVPPYRGMVAYDLTVQVRQMVTLNRDQDLQLVTATWETSGTFVTSQRKFSHSVRSQLQELLTKLGYDFLEANAK